MRLLVALFVLFKLWVTDAVAQNKFLADPQEQALFVNEVPNALDSSFKYQLDDNGSAKEIKVHMCKTEQSTGLRGPGGVRGGKELMTPVWGYSADSDRLCTWPGRTFEVQKDQILQVEWINDLYEPLLTGVGRNSQTSVIDTSIHWAMSLKDCNKDATNPEGEYCGGIQALEENGIPVVPHLHGGHTRSESDGNPEFFFTPKQTITGPQYASNNYVYDNDQPAGTLWYHDHALGITRLNVYAGLAGFYIVRDENDTGKESNPLGLPAGEFEVALAIQDRMFKKHGELFYPAFPGDPFYDDFITGEGAVLDEEVFGKDGGPTVLAEFFGDHMLVNGKIWPKMTVKPREYRLRLLNGCDSRFLVIQFVEVDAGSTDPSTGIPKEFMVIGTDQGLGSKVTTTDTLIFEPGSRYDIVFDFESSAGKRIIMKNLGYDAPFGWEYGDECAEDCFEARLTDRVMAFDVGTTGTPGVPKFDPKKIKYGNRINGPVARTRQLSLFEGTDPFGRLLPVLGLAESGKDEDGSEILWEEDHTGSDLQGSIQGSLVWHNLITENPCNGDTEIWEIYNPTGDSHPIHLHLVTFEVLGRHTIKWHDPSEQVLTEDPIAPLGTYMIEQPIVMHDGSIGSGFALKNPTYERKPLGEIEGIINDGLRDMVTAFPDTVTRIKMTWDRPGRFVWHCHILSHEDSEMMRPLFVHECDMV